MTVLKSAAKANPNNLLVVIQAGIAHLHCGRVEDALAYFHRAIRLSPRDPEAHVSLTGIAHGQMILGDYPEALVWAARSLALNTTFDPTFWMLIAANAHLGHMDEAHRFLGELRRLARRHRWQHSGRTGRQGPDPRCRHSRRPATRRARGRMTRPRSSGLPADRSARGRPLLPLSHGPDCATLHWACATLVAVPHLCCSGMRRRRGIGNTAVNR